MSDPLLQMAQLRRLTIDVDGEKVIIRELSVFEYGEHADLQKTEPKKACVYLLTRCVLNEDGAPRWTDQQAEQIANGTPRIVIPLCDAIRKFTLSSFSEKKPNPRAEVPVPAGSASGDDGDAARTGSAAA